MAVRSAVAGIATVAVLVGVLGSPPVVDEAQELADRHASPITAETLTGFPNWDVFDSATSVETTLGVVLKLAILLVVAGILTAAAGRASRRAALLAGWASVVVAAAAAGAVHDIYEQAVVLDGEQPTAAGYLEHLVDAANAGAGFGLWSGWLVGIAVAVAVRRPAARRMPPAVATGPIARAPGGAPITPPAPWWAEDASPLSPLMHEPPSVSPSEDDTTDADETLADGNDDVDRAPTLATPLARRAGGPRHGPGVE
ncbi:MAG TPA: hypothetical protein VE575_12345 [Acidimicrobiales bacterium]|nr:hypothetical protein [Acidimicrobiales bacterium]